MRVSAIFPPESDGPFEACGPGAAASGTAGHPGSRFTRFTKAQIRAPLGSGRPSERTMRQYAFAALFGLAACATASAPASMRAPVGEAPVLSIVARAARFQLPAPAPQDLGPDLGLWATHYHKPVVRPAGKGAAALPLRDRTGAPISPPLRREDWCAAALQGSVTVRSADGTDAYFAYVDANGPEQTDCDDRLGNLADGVKRATRRARFQTVAHDQGCGSRHIPLLPFRTVAVDPEIIPLGSVIYAPELRGRTFAFEGKLYVHDGYLFAGDHGGAIHGRHVDIFTGAAGSNPFPVLISSTASRTFAAHLVDPGDIADTALRAVHAGVCAGLGP